VAEAVRDGKVKSGIEETPRRMTCAVGYPRGRRPRITRPRQDDERAKADRRLP